MKTVIALCCCALALLNGCAIEAVGGKEFHEPAVPNRMALFESQKGDEVYVVYHESLSSSDRSRQRCYALFANRPQIRQVKKPAFVRLSVTNHMTAVPVFGVDESPKTNQIVSGFYAVRTEREDEFQLFKVDGHEVGTFGLPSYPERLSTVARGAVISAEVLLCCTIVGGIAVWYWEAGASVPVPPLASKAEP